MKFPVITVIKCFKRTGLYPEAEVEEDEDDPFEGEELSSLQLLVNSLNASSARICLL